MENPLLIGTIWDYTVDFFRGPRTRKSRIRLTLHPQQLGLTRALSCNEGPRSKPLGQQILTVRSNIQKSADDDPN